MTLKDSRVTVLSQIGMTEVVMMKRRVRHGDGSSATLFTVDGVIRKCGTRGTIAHCGIRRRHRCNSKGWKESRRDDIKSN